MYNKYSYLCISGCFLVFLFFYRYSSPLHQHEILCYHESTITLRIQEFHIEYVRNYFC